VTTWKKVWSDMESGDDMAMESVDMIRPSGRPARRWRNKLCDYWNLT